MNVPLRRIPFDRMFNARDLGGYAAEGGYTSFGRFIRCDAPHKLSESDIARLLERGLSAVIDLRGPEEIAERPNSFSAFPGIRYLNIPLAEGVSGEEHSIAEDKRMACFYVKLLSEGSRNIAKTMKSIAEYTGAGLLAFHCRGGKDRTGIIAALLFSLCGVSEHDIVADYQISFTLMKPVNDIEMNETTPDRHFTFYSNPENMRTFLKKLKELGGAERYLNSIGLAAWELETLRSAMITKARI